MSYHFTSIQMTTIKKKKTESVGDVEKLEDLCSIGIATTENSAMVPQKTKHRITK